MLIDFWTTGPLWRKDADNHVANLPKKSNSGSEYMVKTTAVERISCHEEFSRELSEATFAASRLIFNWSLIQFNCFLILLSLWCSWNERLNPSSGIVCLLICGLSQLRLLGSSSDFSTMALETMGTKSLTTPAVCFSRFFSSCLHLLCQLF